LAVTVADLKRVANTYLVPEKASIALVTHAGHKELAEKMGLALKTC
jgi:predicted Zn-dependent peptidase